MDRTTLDPSPMDRARGPVVVVALVFGVAVASAVLVMVRGTGSTMPMWIALGPAAGIAAVAALVLAVSLPRRRARKKKASAIEEAAASHGLVYAVTGEKDLHHSFGPLPRIPRGGTVRHVFTGRLDGRALTVFQHTYVVNTGQAVIPVSHTVYVTEAPPWPSLTVARRNLFGRLAHRLGARPGLQLEDTVFNATLRVTTDDEDFALTLLDPEMQQFMAGKASVTWRFNPGCCAMIYAGALRADRMGASLDRMRRFWALVPPELEGY